MGRNVFYPVDSSSIPVATAPPNEDVYIPPTILKNLTPDSFLNQAIRISDIRLNWDTSTVDVTILGVKGEVYTLRVSGGKVSDGLRAGDLMLEEQLFIQYSEVYTPLHLTLEADMEYTFTLFDYHNTPQSIFTFISPVDFASVEVSPAQESEGSRAVTPVPPMLLDKTADSWSIYNVVVIALIGIIALIILLRKKIRRTS